MPSKKPIRNGMLGIRVTLKKLQATYYLMFEWVVGVGHMLVEGLPVVELTISPEAKDAVTASCITYP
jgi:hypothetical protein